MLKLLRLSVVPHSKLSDLATLLLGGTPVCSLVMPLSGGSVGTHVVYAAYFGPFSPFQLALFNLGSFSPTYAGCRIPLSRHRPEPAGNRQPASGGAPSVETGEEAGPVGVFCENKTYESGIRALQWEIRCFL